MDNQVIALLVDIGFSEAEATRQLSELGKVANAKVILEIVGAECEGKTPEEINQLLTDKLQIKENQEIAKEIYSKIGHEYIEAISKDLDNEKTELFLNSLENNFKV